LFTVNIISVIDSKISLHKEQILTSVRYTELILRERVYRAENPVKFDVLLGAVESCICVGAETVLDCFVFLNRKSGIGVRDE
jgi:hypothetical protein